MLLLRPSVSPWKSCWKDDVRIKGDGVVRLQHCFGHDHVNFLLLPFLFPSMTMDGGLSAWCYPSPLSFPKVTMPSWLSRHISRDLDFLKCGCQNGNPQASPQMDRDMIKSPSLCTEEFLVLQFPNVLTEICLSGEGWEGGGSLYNMDLMLGFAHWVFITRPHKKQKSSVEKIKKKFFFFTKIEKSGGLTHSPLCGS